MIAALDGAAENASLRERRTAVVRGLRACPNNLSLETSMDKFVVEAGKCVHVNDWSFYIPLEKCILLFVSNEVDLFPLSFFIPSLSPRA